MFVMTLSLLEQLRQNSAHAARLLELPPEVVTYLTEKMLAASRTNPRARTITYTGQTNGGEGKWADSGMWKSEDLIAAAKAYFEAKGLTCTEERSSDQRDDYHNLYIGW